MSNREFVSHTVDRAPTAARPLLQALHQKLGFVPNAAARMAEAPALLDGFLRLTRGLEELSLTRHEREVLALTVARENGCEVCIAFHGAAVTSLDPSGTLLAALHADRSTGEERLDAIRDFARSVCVHRGDVSADAWTRFLGAGFSRAQALEVVLAAGTLTLSAWANRLTQAPVDPQLRAFLPVEGRAPAR